MANALHTGERDRRIAALAVALDRRTRLDAKLRDALAARRAAHADACTRRDAQRERVEAERARLEGCRAQCAALMSGGAALVPAQLTQAMRYAGHLAERLQPMQAELDALDAVERDEADALAAASRALAANRGRIETCGERIVERRRALDAAAADALDEDHGELAGTRAHLAARVAHR
jgi:chromosome segregation ATPase